MWTGWVMGDGYPLDCYDYQSTCGAKNEIKEQPMKAASKSQGPKRWRREEHLGLAGEGSGVGWSGRVPANDVSY